MHEPTRRSIATERELVPSPRMPHIFMASALWPAAQILQFAREATLGLDVSSGMVASALVLLSNSAADSTEAKATPFPHRLCAIDVPIFIAFAPFGQFNPRRSTGRTIEKLRPYTSLSRIYVRCNRTIGSPFVDRTLTEENHMRPTAITHLSVGRVLSVCRYGALSAAFCFFAVGLTPPVHAECNPNGTANEVIGCIDDANVATKKQLTLFYSRYLQSLDAKCQAEFSSGGSGGHQDRATCLQQKLKDEAARIGMPGK
jgi:hypothetical protein